MEVTQKRAHPVGRRGSPQSTHLNSDPEGVWEGPGATWGNGIPGGGNSQCKGLEANGNSRSVFQTVLCHKQCYIMFKLQLDLCTKNKQDTFPTAANGAQQPDPTPTQRRPVCLPPSRRQHRLPPGCPRHSGILALVLMGSWQSR